MTESPFSDNWYRVAPLAPRLRGHVRVHRHHYRGQLWFVLQDRCSARHFRFSPAAHRIIGLMDGRRTAEEIWEAVSTRLGDDAPTQDETIRILARLHAADLLVCDVGPDADELFRRHERRRQAEWLGKVKNPLCVRFRLLDPDAPLEACRPLARLLFGPVGLVLWLTVVAAGLAQAASHWPELTANLVEHVLSPLNLVLLVACYPFIKALHELGHGLAVKRWGGEVHEMGIMLLVLMPVPYVDASAASAFRQKWRRMTVGAAGILVELAVASLAVLVWVNVEPGLVREAAFTLALIGGVSTVLFNGNPLLRFDGYYVLADAIEIPNLGSRANQYLGYLVQRYLFGLANAESPVSAPGERAWFVGYGIAAMVYRLFVMVGIVLFVAGRFFFVGVVLAVWAAASQLAVPLWKGAVFVLAGPAVERRRARAVTVSALVLGLVLGALWLVPVPSATRAEGVVWVPDDAHVRASTDGFVTRVLVSEGATVTRGQALFETEDPLLPSKVEAIEARLAELRARYDSHRIRERVKADVLAEEIATVAAELERARGRLADLVIRSPVDGVLVVPRAGDLPGRFVRQGEGLGYVLERATPTVRVVLTQADIGDVRERTRSVEVRVAERLDAVIPATVRRAIPAAGTRLPSRSLGSAGGGRVRVDPLDANGLDALDDVFQMEVDLRSDGAAPRLGGRAYVRFDHGHEPLAAQWYRSVRRLLLAHFEV